MSLRRVVLLAFAVFALGLSLPAQEHQPAPAGDASKPEASAQHAQPAGEPAAEADPHAEFKESASVKWLAKTLGLSLPAAYWVSVVLNFAVLAAITFVILRKMNIAGAMRDRTAAIRRQMEEAQRASEAAAQRMRDIEARLASLDTEISGLHSAAEQEARREEERLLAAAAEEKRKIVSGAEQEIAAAAKAARAELRAYAAELAVGLASKQIQVNESTDQAIVREFVDQLGKDAR